MAINKLVVAREWLVLFACLVVGFVATPLLFFRTYEARDLAREQKVDLLTREQKIEMAKEKQKQRRYYDSLVAASRYDVTGIPRKSFDPDRYLAMKQSETFDFDGYLEGRGIVLRISAWEQFTGHLFSWRYFLETWASVLLVYVVVQILRSLFWAVRIVTRKQ